MAFFIGKQDIFCDTYQSKAININNILELFNKLLINHEF